MSNARKNRGTGNTNFKARRDAWDRIYGERKFSKTKDKKKEK